MAKNQSKEFVKNQEFLVEAWKEHGGPDGFRQHYLDMGAQQERNRLLQIGKTCVYYAWKIAEPFVLKIAGEKVIDFLDKHKREKEPDA